MANANRYFLNNSLYLSYNTSLDCFYITCLHGDSLLVKKEKKYLNFYKQDIQIRENKDEKVILFDIKNTKNLKPLRELALKNDYKLFFKIAINLSLKIKEFHKNNLLHANLTLDSIFVDEFYNVYIFNFSNSIEYNNNSTGFSSVYFKNLPLLNKSPEQLGRINTEVDLRSDIFSLGLIFYELLIGKHPFIAEDELEILHQILTKNIEKIDTVPFNMSELIVKSLRKEVLFRYQSISGLIYDLKLLQEDLEKEFIVAQKDISSRLQFPQKVYGRKKEISFLYKTYKKVLKKKRKTVFISGYSGVGKSSLIDALKNKIIIDNNYFISSKFDQYNTGLPHYAISEAFSTLIKQILTKNENEQELIKRNILNALKGNGQILIDIIPNLEKLIGKQKEVEKLPANESENRFNQVFLNFIKAITNKESSLILVVDDLQWMDLATLKLLETIIDDEELTYVYILGAYRSNEIKNNFSLKSIIDNNTNIETLQLKPLKKKSLHKFITDTLFLKEEDCLDLVDEVYTKTAANPFFFRQFIKKLFDEKFIYFSYDLLTWKYDIEKIKRENITDNVASFMLGSISDLDYTSLKYLQIASCLGASFDLRIIEKIEGENIEKIIKSMLHIFDSGFLIPIDVDIHNKSDIKKSSSIKIKFLHDQVQQAVYSTIEEIILLNLHYEIGNTLLNDKETTFSPFEILSHLNASRILIKEDKDLIDLVSLNIKASNLAKASTAYDSSLMYLIIAKELLEKLDLEENYNLYFNTCLDCVELLYLTSDFENANNEKNKLFKIIRNIDDEVSLRRILTVQYTRIGKLDDAIDEALKSLSLLDLKISKNITMEDLQNEIVDTQNILKETSFSKIAELAEIKDIKVLKILDILMEMQPASYNSGSLIFPITILKSLKFTMSHGNTYLSYYIYMMYALMNSKVLKDYDIAFEASKYAKLIKNKYPKSILSGRFNMMLANFIMPWQNQINESSKLRAQAYEECLEFGDYYWGIHSYIFGFYANMLVSDNLDDLYIKTKSIAATSKKINQISQYYLCHMQMNLIKVLNGKLNNFDDLNHKKGFEEKALLEYENQNYMCGKYDFIVSRLMQGFFFGNYQKALDVSLPENLDVSQLDEGIFHEAFYKVFNILSILLLDIEDGFKNESEKKRYYSFIDENIKFIDIWKINSPDIFLCIDSLIKALQAQISGDISLCIDEFEKSINYSNELNSILLKAICSELFAQFWLKRKNTKISDMYFSEAINLYKSWKAFGKVEQLKLKMNILKNSYDNDSSLDLNLIIKSSNIISKDIKLEKLMQNILEIVFKFSGAQNGFIFLNEEKINLAAQINKNSFNYYLNDKSKKTIVPIDIISYVNKTKEILLLNDMSKNELIFNDNYLDKYNPKSLLCIPLILNAEVKIIIYLENFNQSNIFSKRSIDTIKLLSTQMLISIENTYFYENLEKLVENRTKDLENTLSLFDMGQMLLFKWENSSTWPVSYLSNNVKSILGYEREEFLNGNISYLDIIHKDDKENILAEVDTASNNNEDIVVHKTYRIKHKNGNYLWIYDSTKIIYNEKNEVSHYLGYIVDISKEKKRENYLLQQTKMIALGEMIGNIAHQWRQPLSLISTSASSLKLKKELNILEDIDINESSDIILKTVEDLSKTIDDFRDFLCIDKTYFDEYYLEDIIRKAYKMISHFFINYNIKLEKDIQRDLKIKCSESQLVQVFINILSNAKDALLLNNSNENKCIQIKAFKKLNSLHIFIKDNAGGISPEIKDKIFEPYFTTKHQSQGTGLGLYLTHQIITNELEGEIEVINDDIVVENKKYTGACFCIHLSE